MTTLKERITEDMPATAAASAAAGGGGGASSKPPSARRHSYAITWRAAARFRDPYSGATGMRSAAWQR